MGDYLRNVAHRTVGASLLRPRVPSRFEPVAGMGLAMNHFRAVTIEQEVDALRAREVVETRVEPPSVAPLRTKEPQMSHEEPRVGKPAAIRPAQDLPVRQLHKADDRKAVNMEVRKNQTESPSGPVEETVSNVRVDSIEERNDVPVTIPREIVRERVEIRREPTAHRESPTPEPVLHSEKPSFPEPKPERPERRPTMTKPVPQVRDRESAQLSPVGVYAEFAHPRSETRAPSVHVTIGKLTVQATLPAAAVPAPARAAAASSPSLTLEAYLNRRGGRA